MVKTTAASRQGAAAAAGLAGLEFPPYGRMPVEEETLAQTGPLPANFTEAGQDRNIEVGLKICNEWLANQLTMHFQQLREHGLAVRAF